MLTDNSYGKFKYILYRPYGDNLPLIVVLHGSGEIGSDLGKLKKREPYISLNNGKCKPGAVILMPQLPKGTWGECKADLKKLIDHVAEEQGCDVKRVSITGHSLGANGTLDMLLAYPDYFSAASVLSPCKDIGSRMNEIQHIPMWFLAGEKEHNYKKYAQSMYDRLTKLGGVAKLTLVPGVGHPIQFTWVSDKYQMFDWLASYRLDRFIIDVSKHQGHIDWNRLAPHLAFCIIKASGLYGNGSDPYYERNVTEAVAHGVPFHAYHFLYCVTEVQAKRDAKLFFDTVKAGGHWPLFWVLDCESQWGIKDNQAAPIGRIFEDELRRLAREQGPGEIRVAIYVGQEMYKRWAFDYSHFAYVWIPGYGEKYKPPMPCDMWQYTSKGRLPGVSGNVDLNKLMGTKPLSFFTTGAEDSGEQGGDSTTDEPTDGGESQMFTGKELATYCETMYANKNHWAYWYGTYGNVCTMKKYESKKKQYPDHYGSSRTKGYMKDIEQGRRCADCVGMIKSFFWTGNHYDTDPKYGSNDCPDKSANGMIDLCKVKGDISTIPDIPGVVVWTNGHIGVYIGDGYTIEMRGFDYDCVKRKVKDGPWKKWGKLPMLSYDEPKPEPSEYGHVLVTGGSVNIRSAPGVKSKDIGTAHRGDLLVYQGVTQEADGKPWYLIIWENQNAWISSKYSKLVE
jgi:GH25 family lysozyme M1 (1,4-beta-N-acetylmuramidase)